VCDRASHVAVLDGKSIQSDDESEQSVVRYGVARRNHVWMRWVWAVVLVSCALAVAGCGAAPSDSTPSPFFRLRGNGSTATTDDPDGGDNSVPVYPTNTPGDPGEPQ
jgi:hypothetical protein